MLLWILCAVMTAGAALVVLAPLARAARDGSPGGSHDVGVYRDQLAEVDRDVERGVIGSAEAEAARTEIGRRLIKAARVAEVTAPIPTAVPPRVVTILALVGIPAVAVATYLALGQPDLPDQPLEARRAVPAETRGIDDLVAEAEARLAANPDDVRGWDVLAPVYMGLRRLDDAANAYRTAIRIAGSTVGREVGLGEALTLIAGGVVTAEARGAFDRAVAFEPDLVLPRLYLALALSQDGRNAEAAAAWGALVAGAKGDEPWLERARAELAEAEGKSAGGPRALGASPSVDASDSGAPAARGPSPDDVAAAGAMAPADRLKMIEIMVERLAERLATGGGSAEDWAKLVRSLSVLGRPDDAKAAAERARTALAADAAGLARLDTLVKPLGLPQ